MRRSLVPCVLGFLLSACSGGDDVAAPITPPADAAQDVMDASAEATLDVADTGSDDATDASAEAESGVLADAMAEDGETAEGGDAGLPINRCGAAPFDWLPADLMGKVLEKQAKAPHSKVDLSLGVIQLVSDGQLKTTRLPSYNTKSALVRYQTQDRGKLVDATAMVTWPDEAKTFPLLLILHGTSGFHDGCGPTAGMVDAELGGLTNETGLLLALYASFGYVTVFPDYIGLKSLGDPTGFMHPYLVAEPTAIASLDSLRAAKSVLAATSVTPGDVIVVGGSQGGHAAAFVNRFAPYYAPEFDIKASVWDVPPSDMVGQSKVALESSWIKASGSVVSFLTAAESWYGASQSGLTEVLRPPFDTEAVTRMSTECNGLKLTNPTLETVFTPEIRSAAVEPGFGTMPPWSCYVRENGLQTTSLPRKDNVPSLFLLGQNDDLVNPNVERAAFQELCSQGLQLVYLECAGAGHTQPLVWAFDQIFEFVEDRLDGKPMPADTCVVKPAEKCTSTP